MKTELVLYVCVFTLIRILGSAVLEVPELLDALAKDPCEELRFAIKQ